MPKRAKRPAPLYLIAPGPAPYPIGSIGHDDESLDWQMEIAPLGSPPTKVPGRPAHVQREVCQMLRFGPYREANAKGEPLMPFPQIPPPPTATQKGAALKATALERARERSYEPGRLGMGAAGGYYEALTELIGNGRGTMAGVGHEGVPRLLRDAFLAESYYRENRERAGSLEEWARLAARERLNFYASVSFQDEANALGYQVEILSALITRAKTPDEARAIDRQKKLVRLSSKRLAGAALGSPPPGRKQRSKTRKSRASFVTPKPSRSR